MILSIHQPSYFPWLGLLHKIAASDVFVLMDEVQLADRAYQHRNLFLTAQGQTRYLSIPFARKGYREQRFRDVALAEPAWGARHLDFFTANYRRHPFAAEVMPALTHLLSTPYATLFDAVLASMRLCLDLLAIPTRIVLQSELAYDRSLRKGDLIVALARAAGADCYLSGTGARAYLDESAFSDGLALRYDRFTHPEYPQRHSAAFVPGLACLDLLFNVGAADARACLNAASPP